MSLNRFLNSHAPVFCMDQAGTDGAAGGAAGAPAKATADTNANASASATTGTTAGDAAKASGEGNSAAATVTQAVGKDAATATGDFREGWTDDLKNDPSLKDFKDTATLAKALVDTKKLVGQKLGIPAADATPEAKEAFYTALGVPKEAKGYEFKQPDKLPDALKDTYDQAHADKWADIFKKHNVPKEAANALRNEIFNEITAELGEMNAEVEKSDKQFNDLAISIYGDKPKAEAALQAARTTIEKHLPPALKGAMNQLSNTALLAVAAAVSGAMKEQTGEDRTITQDNGTGGDGKTVAQLREEAREMQSRPEYSSPFTAKGKVAHETLVKEVKDIYARIDRMGASKA